MAPWCLFWCLSLFSKQNWAFPRSPNVFPTCVPTTPIYKYIYNTKYIDPSACNVPLVPLVSFDIISKTFNLNLLVPPIVQKKKIHVELSALGVFNLFFNTHVKLFALIWLFIVGILVFLFFPIFHHPWCCSSVFLLLRKLRSSPNQNIPMSHQFKSLLRMSRFENVCYVDNPSWDVLLRPWPSNNHNSSKKLYKC
jgi:hypothetical protein